MSNYTYLLKCADDTLYCGWTNDLDQIILVYCRSGRRSKEASQKLADIGYTCVYEFGGINTWTGEIVK